MPLVQIDLSGYLNARRRMRLLPNLLDFGMVYSVFRPMLRIDAVVLRPFERLKGEPQGSNIINMIMTDPLLFTSAAMAYLLFALFQVILAVALTSKIKSLVLSDSQRTIILFGTFFLIIGVAQFITFAGIMGVWWALAFSVIPFVYVYAALTYFRQLKALKKHPVYRCLVGVKRRSFTFATTRYAFFSFNSLKVYGNILVASWKVYLAYIGLGVLILSLYVAPRSQLAQNLNDSFKELHGGIQLLIALVVFLLLSQMVAYTRRFISNETTRFVRELRTRLARSASALAQKDDRPPILLLRSFQDDGIFVENERYWGHRFLGIRDEQIRLEEVIAENLYPYGPLIALSNPDDALPPLGAARENVDNPVWQRTVEQFMEQASKIVLIIGVTQSLRWEVNRILSRGFKEKCLFVFPPAYRGLTDKSLLLVNCLPELGHKIGLQSEEDEMATLSDALLLSDIGQADTIVIKASTNGHRAMAYAEALRLDVNLVKLLAAA